MMQFLDGVLAVLLLLAAVVVIKAALLKPTPAKTAKIELDHSERAAEYGKRLAKMVQIETISSRQNTDYTKFYELHKELEKLFPEIHRVCEKHDFDGSLLFRWKGEGTYAPILLMSHMDVVEATGCWQNEPFSGEIDEYGRVWGRGTVDTKGSLFCIMTAIEELIQTGYKPAGDVYIASSCTEEISGTGAPKIVK